MREFIRHPASVPIQVKELDGDPEIGLCTLNNVSIGGISCISAHPVELGASVTIRVECVDPDFEMTGQVVWCRQNETAYEVGVEFLTSKQNMFLLRMVEQLCHIEHYRNEVERTEGRALSSEQAAQEWISKYAATFPA